MKSKAPIVGFLLTLVGSLLLLAMASKTVQASPQNCASRSPLLAQAYVLLCGSDLPTDWQAADGWRNEGTGGAGSSAKFDTNAIGPNAFFNNTAQRISSGVDTPPAIFAPPINPGDYGGYGFYIPSSEAINVPDSGGMTFTVDFDPNGIDYFHRLLFKYDGSEMRDSGNGWVMENLDFSYDPSPGQHPNSFSTGTYDGTSFAGGLIFNHIPGRQQLTIRANRDDGTWSIFRNGINITDPANVHTLGLIGSSSNNVPVRFSPGNTIYNVVAYNRALSDEEIAHLHSILSTGSDNEITTSNVDQPKPKLRKTRPSSGYSSFVKSVSSSSPNYPMQSSTSPLNTSDKQQSVTSQVSNSGAPRKSKSRKTASVELGAILLIVTIMGLYWGLKMHNRLSSKHFKL